MIRRIAAIGLALSFVPLAALADDIGGSDVIVIEQEEVVVVDEEPVTAPPPPWVELESTAIGAGIGARFGDGTLLVEGQEHPFSVKGLAIGDIGFSKLTAEGAVENLNDVSDFAGRYVAVEAAAAVGKGASALTMRNQNGVTIRLQGDLTGAQLTLAAQGFDIELR